MKTQNPHHITKVSSATKSHAKRWFLQAYAIAVATFLIPMTANAAISDWFENIGEEFEAVVPILVFILGAVGIVLVGIGIISTITAKKNRQPIEYQHWMIIGGVLCVLLIPFVLALGESVSGQNATGNLKGILGAVEYVYLKSTIA